MSNRSPLPRTVILLGWLSFITDVGSEMIFPLVPLFLAETLGGRATFVGLVEGSADAVAALLKLWTGRWSDRLGRRRPFVIAGYGLASIVRPVVALATAPWHVLVVRVTDRVGKGLRTAPRDALLADSVPASETGRAFGFHRAMDHAGAVLGPLIATSLLVAGASFRTVFSLAIIPGLIAVALSFLVRETPHAPGVVAPKAGPLPSSIRRALIPFGVFALGNSSDAFILLRAKQLGVEEWALPLVWSALSVSKVVCSRWGGALADRFPRRRIVTAGWTAYAICYGLLSLDLPMIPALFVIVAYGAYHGLAEPAERALVGDLAPAGARGQAFGAYHSLTGLISLPAGLLTGWVWEAAGSGPAFLSCAGFAVAGALLVVRGPKQAV